MMIVPAAGFTAMMTGYIIQADKTVDYLSFLFGYYNAYHPYAEDDEVGCLDFDRREG